MAVPTVDDCRGGQPRDDRVVAVAAVDDGGRRCAEDVVPVAAHDRVGAVFTVDAIVALAAVDPVGTGTGGQAVAAAQTEDRVVAIAAGDLVVACSAVKFVRT